MKAWRHCALILGDALVACIETLLEALAEAELAEKRAVRLERARGREAKRAQGPLWLQEAREVRAPK